MLGDAININHFNCNPVAVVLKKKKLAKPLNITIFRPNLCKKGVTMGHIQNKKYIYIFFTEITRPNHKLSKTFYLIKISCFGWVLKVFSIVCYVFLLKRLISSQKSCDLQKGSVFLTLQVSNLKHEFLDRYFSTTFIRIKWN